MEIADAQREMREVYLDKGPGEGVAALVWFVSEAIATWSSPRAGAWALVLGGMVIYPLMVLCLKLLGQRTSTSATNPLNPLAPQVAFVVPLIMPLAGVAMLYRESWFYPAFMVIVGAHYLPFAFLYGTRSFLVLAGLLLMGGFGLAFGGVQSFSLGGWLTGTVLAVFSAARHLRRAPRPA